MNNMKKLLALVLCFAALTAVSGCGKQKETTRLLTDETSASTEETTEETSEETTEATTETTAAETETDTEGETTAAPTTAAPVATTTALRTIPPAVTAPPKATTLAPAATTAAHAATTAAPATTAALATTAAPTQDLTPPPLDATTPAADTPTNPPMPGASGMDENAMKFSANGAEAIVGSSVDAFVAANAPVKQETAPNCLGGVGQQIEYSYADYVITADETTHKVMFIDITGPSISTAKGIHVGSSKADVEAQYGAGGTYKVGGYSLTFTYKDDMVTMITMGE